MSQPPEASFRPFDFRGRLIVHVGTHKTGSTSIQAYCMDNYEALWRDGCLYPRAGRIDQRGTEVLNHHPLIRSIIGESPHLLEAQLTALGEEIVAAGPQVVVLSSEILSREYLSAAPFEVIRSLFPHAQREWVIFLRRQADVLASRYAEMIKTRDIAWPHGIELVDSPFYLDHRLRLEKLRYAVQDDEVRVLSFDSQKSRVIDAFFETCGLAVTAGSEAKIYHRNPSLPWGTLHVLRLTNRLPRPLERYARSLALLIGRALADTPAGFLVSWGQPLSTRARARIAQRYRAGNRWVEEEFFGGDLVLDPDRPTPS